MGTRETWPRVRNAFHHHRHASRSQDAAYPAACRVEKSSPTEFRRSSSKVTVGVGGDLEDSALSQALVKAVGCFPFTRYN